MGMPLFEVEYLRNGTGQKHSYDGVTYALLKDVISNALNDLAQFSMTWSVARPLGYSRVSCDVATGTEEPVNIHDADDTAAYA